jgi:hypothetical protein
MSSLKMKKFPTIKVSGGEKRGRAGGGSRNGLFLPSVFSPPPKYLLPVPLKVFAHEIKLA